MVKKINFEINISKITNSVITGRQGSKNQLFTEKS
jgi:hypothetical protein